MNDNRNYNYTENSITKRREYEIVARHVKKSSKVIDLASGDGSLLKLLIDKKMVKGLGVEVASSGIKSARQKGVKSIRGRIDVRLPFKDKEFDFAICNVTLQMVMYPEVLLREMVRISKRQIVTFPNFGYIMNRLELLFTGKMPRFMLGDYKWFSTGLIHQLSLKDFIDFCKNNNIEIVKTDHIFPNRLFILPKVILKISPNLFASGAVFITSAMKNKHPHLRQITNLINILNHSERSK